MPLSEERDVALQNHRLNKRKLSENGENEKNTKGCVQIILSVALQKPIWSTAVAELLYTEADFCFFAAMLANYYLDRTMS